MSCVVSSFNPLGHLICLAYPKRIGPSTWTAHVPFGMFLIDALRPKVVVELGTYYGVSYCAFCQAVRELGLDTKCHAVDTWRGDPQSQYFDANVLGNLRAHHDPLYAGFSQLIQQTFLEASKSFADGGIDLLHIDGYHTYDAVNQDYQTWLPKMSPRGVMFFHDIHVREPGFGVWQLWEELKHQYPNFELLHGCGLGLLVTGPEESPTVRRLVEATDGEAAQIREYFGRLGAWLEKDAQNQFSMDKQRRRIGELESFVERVRRHPLFKVYHWIKYLGKNPE